MSTETIDLNPDGIEFGPPLYWGVDEDGCYHDIDTGEILDPSLHASQGGPLDEVESIKARFLVDTRERAEWALARRSECEARIAALKLRRDAWLANLNSQIRQEELRLRWWEYRFWPGVVAVARTMLRGKGKTAQFDHGKVSFRTVPSRPKLADEAEALAWMRIWRPDKVRVRHEEWVNASDVAKAAIDLADDMAGEVLSLPFLKFDQARESVKIITGVMPGKGESDAD